MASGEISGGSIQVRGLRKVYGSNPQTQKLAVRDLWFNIPKGECFGFLGINGAGK
jgi:ATP-binding cassette subfamily A (ABC1) protein 1